jgi:hypothetical protein
VTKEVPGYAGLYTRDLTGPSMRLLTADICTAVGLDTYADAETVDIILVRKNP